MEEERGVMEIPGCTATCWYSRLAAGRYLVIWRLMQGDSSDTVVDLVFLFVLLDYETIFERDWIG